MTTSSIPSGPVLRRLRGRVLVVDDEPGVRRVIVRLLAHHLPDVHVEEAASAEEALLRMASAPYDLVVSDLRMGKMSGSDLLAWVREARRGTARALMTGYNDALDTASSRGLDAVIKKPWENDRLLALIEALLHARGEDSPASGTSPSAGSLAER